MNPEIYKIFRLKILIILLFLQKIGSIKIWKYCKLKKTLKTTEKQIQNNNYWLNNYFNYTNI